MNLSARGNEFWIHLGRSKSEERFSAAEHFFRINDLPPVAPFIECVALVGGMTIDVPCDSLHFFSTADLERLAKGFPIRVSFFGDPADEWYYACDCWFPGHIFLHRSGSFHFESDPNEKWASSLSEIIEEAALLWSVGKTTLRFKLGGFFTAPSLSMLGERLNCAPDPYASSAFREHYCYLGGIVTALRIHEFETRGSCAIAALLPTWEAVVLLQEDLYGLLNTARVKSIAPDSRWASPG